MKELTGDSTINARINYSNNCTTELNMTLEMECNTFPKLDEVGSAVERRIRAIPFKTNFVEEIKYDLLEDKTGYGILNTLYKTDEFKQEYKQALFSILIEVWKGFQANKYVMIKLPECCSKLTKDWLSCSDDIHEWYIEKYEPSINDIVYVDDVYKLMTSSAYWENLSKNDKRSMTKKKFTENIEKNLFLSKAFKPADTYHNNERIRKPFIVGYKRIITESDHDFDNIDNDDEKTTVVN